MDFGARLKVLRTRAQKSRYKLAKFAGLDQAFLRRLETGERGPSRKTALKLGIALGHGSDAITLADIDDLLFDGGFAPLTRAR